MNELLESAKAVIEEWDTCMKHDGVCEGIESRFRAAVKRDEMQDAAVGFGEWFKRFFLRHSPIDRQMLADQAWHSAVAFATQAERERIKDLLRQSDDWFEDEQMEQAKWLLEKIDATAK